MPYKINLPGPGDKKPSNTKKVTYINADLVNPLTGQARKEKINIGIYRPVHSFSKDMYYLGRVNQFIPDKDIVAQYAYNQSNWERAGASLWNFALQTAGAFVSSAGATLDLSSGLKAAGIVKGSMDNGFTRLSDEILSHQAEIYERNPGKFDPSDPAAWFNWFASSGTSLGMMLETVAETALLAALTGGTGGIEEIANIGKKSKNLFEFAKTASKSKKIKNYATVVGSYQRYKESIQESKQSYDQVYQAFLDNGYSKEEASAIASRAASQTFGLNMALLPLDIAATRAMFVNPVAGSTEGIVEKFISSMGSKVGRMAAKGGIQILSEGTEEFAQNVFQNFSMLDAETSSGLVLKDSRGNFLSGELTNADNWNAFAAGAMGGLLMDASSSLLRKPTEIRNKKYFDDKYSTFKNKINATRTVLIDEIRQAQERGDTQSAKTYRRQLNILTAVNGLHLQEMSDNQVQSFESYKEMVTTIINGLQNKDKDIYEDLNIRSDTEAKAALDEFNTYLKDLDKLSESYETHRDKVDKNSLTNVVYYDFLRKEYGKQDEELGNVIEEQYTQFTTNPEELELLRLHSKAAALDVMIDKLKSELKTSINKNSKVNEKETNKQINKLLDEEDFEQLSKTTTKELNIDELKGKVKKLKYFKEKRKELETTFDEVSKNENLNEVYNNLKKKVDYDNDAKLSLIKNHFDKYNLEFNKDESNRLYNKWVDPRHQEKVIDDIVEGMKNNKDLNKDEPDLVEQKGQDKEPTKEQVVKEGTSKTVIKTNSFFVNPAKSYHEIERESLHLFQAVDAILNTKEFLVESENYTKKQLEEKLKESKTKLQKNIRLLQNKKEHLSKVNKKKYRKKIAYYKEQIRILNELKEDNIALQNRLKKTDSILEALKIKDEHLEKLKEAKEKAEAARNKINKKEPVKEESKDETKEELTKTQEAIKELGKRVQPETTEEAASDTEVKDLDKKDDVVDEVIDEDALGDGLVFEPKSLERELTEEDKALLINLIGKEIQFLEKELGRKPTFEDYLNKVKEINDVEQIDKNFPLYVIGWEGNGMPKEDYYKIYNSVFDPFKETQSKISELSALYSGEEEAKVIEENQEDIDTSPVTEPDERKVEGIKTVTESMKAAFQFIDRNGQIIDNTDIDSEKCVDYDYMKPGREFKVKIAEDYENVMISVYNDDGTKQIMTFGEYVGKNRLRPSDEDYINNIPLVAVDPDTGEQIFFIHSTSWYNPKNIGHEGNPEETRTLINNMRKKTYLFRKYTLDKLNKNQDHIIKITNVGGSSVYSVDEDMLGALSEYAPHTQVSYYINGDILLNGKKYTLTDNITTFEDDRIVIQNTSGKSIPNGSNVELRFIGYEYKNGKEYKLYRLFKVIRPNVLMDTGIIDSVQNAIKIYLTNKNNIHSEIIKQLMPYVGDISVTTGLINYIRSLTHAYIETIGEGVDFNARVKEVVGNIKQSMRRGEGYNKDLPIIVILGGNVVLASSQSEEIIVLNKRTKDNHIMSSVDRFFNKYGTSLRVTTNARALQEYSNKKFSFIDATGGYSVNDKYTLQDILKNNFFTNIKSFNIGTKNSPKYITRTQPRIEFNSTDQDNLDKRFDKIPLGKKIKDKTSNLTSKLKKKEEVKSEEEINTEYENKKAKDELKDISANTDTTNDTTPVEDDEELLNILEQANSIETSVTEVKLSDDIDEDLENILNEIEDNKNEISFREPRFIDEDEFEKIRQSYNEIEGLTTIELHTVVTYMYNSFLREFDKGQYISKKDIMSKLTDDFEKLLEPSIESINNTINNSISVLKRHKDNLTTTQKEKILTLVKVKQQELAKLETIIKNKNKIAKLAYKEVKLRTGIVEKKIDENATILEISEDLTDDERRNDEDSLDQEDIEGRTKELGKSVLEENGKERLPYKLRRFFSGLKQLDKTGQQVKGAFELPLFHDFDYIYDKVAEIILAYGDVAPTYEEMKARLLSAKAAHPWVEELVKRLDNTDEQTKIQFVVNFAKHFINMKSPMFGKDFKRNTYNLMLFDTNSNSVKRRILNDWDQSFLLSDLFRYTEGKFYINEDKLKEAIKQFEDMLPPEDYGNVEVDVSLYKEMLIMARGKGGKLYGDKLKPFKDIIDKLKPGSKASVTLRNSTKKFRIVITKDDKGNITYTGQTNVKGEISIQKVKAAFENIGVHLSTDTLEELNDKGLKIFYNNKVKFIKLKGLLNPNGNISPLGKIISLLYNLEDNIESYKKGKSAESLPLLSAIMSTYGLKLAAIESKYSNQVSSTSINDGKKNIYLINLPNYTSDMAYKIKNDEDYRQKLLNLSLTSENLILRKLQEDDKFKEGFALSHIALDALKELGKKTRGSNKITDQSPTDYDLIAMVLLQDLKSARTMTGIYHGVELRHIRTMFPTFSDKTQQLILDNVGFKITYNHFEFREGNIDKINKSLLTALYYQTVRPEIKRIHKNIKSEVETGIKGYDTFSKLFTILPGLNKFRKGGQSFQELMLQYDNIEDFERNHISDILAEIERLFVNKINDKFSEFVQNGFFNINEDGEFKINYMDQNFLKELDINDERELAYVATADYVINTFVGLTNINQIFAGDLAYYGKDKDVDSKNFEVDKNNEPIPYRVKNPDIYDDLFNNINVNASKRMAMLIAPGLKAYESNKEKYLQIMLQDAETNAANLEYLIELHYGVKEARKAAKEIENLKIIDTHLSNVELNTEVLSEEEITELKSQKDKILKNLKRYNVISDFLEIESTDAQEFTTLSEHINVLYRYGKLTEKQYTDIKGKIKKQRQFEKQNKPIPDEYLLTKDDLDVVLQPLKPVYGGSMLDEDNDTNHVIYIKSSSIPLIPQVTAGKEIDKLRRAMEELEESEIEKGSHRTVRASFQTANKVGALKKALKIFTPDGRIKNLTSTHLANHSIELNREYFKIQQEIPYKAGKHKPNMVTLGTQMMKELFGNDMINKEFEYNGNKVTGEALAIYYNTLFAKRIDLNEKLLLDKLGLKNLSDHKQLAYKLKSLLIEEAESRGMYTKDLEQLKIKIVNGKPIFDVPLWLLPQAEKLESVAISLIRNAIIKLKMPGYSYVASTAEGWSLTNEENYRDDIIYTKYYDKEKGLQVTHKEGNKLKKVQVFVPSRFKDKEGNLVDIFGEKNKGKYWEYENGRKVLIEGMIDDELLSMITFRIPTSSHVSMSDVEIAGFIPEIQGDIIVVPNTILPQKGLDFDVDKEFAYFYWHELDEEGRIKKVGKGENLEKLEDKIKSLEKQRVKYKKKKEKDKVKEIEEKLEEAKDLYSKTIDNEIIKVHHSVLSSPDNEVQDKINKVLSIEFAKEQASLLEKLNKDSSKTYLGFADIDYQRDTMQRGSSGKMAIGVYAQAVTFLSLTQQANKITIKELKEKPIVFLGEDFEGGRVRIVSNGKIGNQRTLDGNRTIAEVLDERVNTGTDDMKVQILGRVNVNKYTISVDSLMALLGYDQALVGNEIISIPYFFLSQPIIKKYVEEMMNLDSNTNTEYGDKHAIAYSNAMKNLNLSPEEYQALNDNSNAFTFSVKDLYDNIGTSKDRLFQARILRAFNFLKGIADEEVRPLTKLFGINNKFKGSMEDIIDLSNTLDNVSGKGFDNLFTNFTKFEDVNLEAFGLEHYSRVANPVAYMIGKSLGLNESLFSEFFIQYQQEFNMLYEEISSYTDTSTSAQGKQLKKDILKELKRFIYSSSKIGLTKGDVAVQRAKLDIDTDTNMSLARYLYELKIQKHQIFDNPLLSRLTFDINRDGTPSLIKFINANNSLLYEDVLYTALDELIEANLELPSYNYNNSSYKEISSEEFEKELIEGKTTILSKNPIDAFGNEKIVKFSYGRKKYKARFVAKHNKNTLTKKYPTLKDTGFETVYEYKIEPFYTTRDLANDLITYSLLNNAVQGAVEIVKYIPLSWFKMTSVNLSNLNFSNQLNDVLFNSERETEGIPFVTQFFQNNPEKATRVKDASEAKQLWEGSNIPYASMYDSKTDSKFRLFYKGKEIPVLSHWAIKQYDADREVMKKIKDYLQEENKEKVEPPKSEPTSKKNGKTADEVALHYIRKNIQEYRISDILEALTDRIKLDIPVYKVKSNDFVAVYSEGKIALTDTFLSLDDKDQARVFLHEYLHAVSVEYLSDYFYYDEEIGKTQIKQGAPKYAKDLYEVYNKAVEAFKDDPAYKSMKEKYKRLSNKEEGITFNQKEKAYYHLATIEEFITGIFTRPLFQEKLASIPYNEKQNLLSKFKDIIMDLLESLGIFKEGTLLRESAKRALVFIDNTLPSYRQDYIFEENSPIENPTPKTAISNNVSNKKVTAKLIRNLNTIETIEGEIIKHPTLDAHFLIFKDKTGHYRAIHYESGRLIKSNLYDSAEAAKDAMIKGLFPKTDFIKDMMKLKVINKPEAEVEPIKKDKVSPEKGFVYNGKEYNNVEVAIKENIDLTNKFTAIEQIIDVIHAYETINPSYIETNKKIMGDMAYATKANSLYKKLTDKHREPLSDIIENNFNFDEYFNIDELNDLNC